MSVWLTHTLISIKFVDVLAVAATTAAAAAVDDAAASRQPPQGNAPHTFCISKTFISHDIIRQLSSKTTQL